MLSSRVIEVNQKKYIADKKYVDHAAKCLLSPGIPRNLFVIKTEILQ